MTSIDSGIGPIPTQTEGETLTTRSEGPWMFTLDYPRPPKGLHANDRVHYMAKAGATADIRQEVFARVRALRIGTLKRIRVDIVWVVKDHIKRDEDGPEPLCKAIYDGIGSDRGVSAHVVEDDGREFFEKPRLIVRYEKGAHPHFEVTITDLGVVA
jgi:hypothetical protein